MFSPALNSSPLTFAYGCVFVLGLGRYFYQRCLQTKVTPVKYPPVVHIPASEMFNNPRKAYEDALAQHGHIIGVRKAGRLEYIVDDYFAQEVLTSDKHFSFERGTAAILNLHYFYGVFRSFFTDIDDLVHNGIIPRIGIIVKQVGPVFAKHADSLIQQSQPSDARTTPNGEDLRAVDLFQHARKSIAEALVIAIFGEQFVNERNVAIVDNVAADIAVLTGIYQNTSIWAQTFPKLRRLYVWLRVVFTTVIFGYFCILGPQILAELRERVRLQDHSISAKEKYQDGAAEDGSVLGYLAHKYAIVEDGYARLPIFSAYWIMTILLLIIFGSVHQTAAVVVWTVFELSNRPEYIPKLREEMQSNAPTDPATGHPIMTYAALRGAVHLDSFIREVFRTKGDTLSACRMTTRDVELGGYTIPKGFLVLPMATLSHMNPKYHGLDANEFDGNRWCASSNTKQAVTVSPSYYPFGLGRWACPGRVLAVAEIKMVVWSIICRSTPRLRGNTYRIVDLQNITSVPPEGDLVLEIYNCQDTAKGNERSSINRP